MYVFNVKGFHQPIKLLEISILVMIQPPMQCYKALRLKDLSIDEMVGA